MIQHMAIVICHQQTQSVHLHRLSTSIDAAERPVNHRAMFRHVNTCSDCVHLKRAVVRHTVGVTLANINQPSIDANMVDAVWRLLFFWRKVCESRCSFSEGQVTDGRPSYWMGRRFSTGRPTGPTTVEHEIIFSNEDK